MQHSIEKQRCDTMMLEHILTQLKVSAEIMQRAVVKINVSHLRLSCLFLEWDPMSRNNLLV